tara:strand:- start:61244 stop:63853 length:2610 start_codon:yes stop_codon:yes gene_type:complete
MRDVVVRCRKRLQQGREKCREQHDNGAMGFQVSTRMADLYDDLVLEVWDQAVSEYEGDSQLSGLALVAHGGFGRRDLAPYSDADLMLLTTSKSTPLAEKIAGTLTRDLVDVGFQVGFSIRRPSEACKLSWADAVIFSSLTESRLLGGSLAVYSRFFPMLRQGAMRRRNSLIKQVIAARREERQKWGETNYLLRPNVKRSRGGLRDIQLVRWIGFMRTGEVELDRLVQLGALFEEDFRVLRRAYEFMLRLRNELHFRARRSQDVLDRPTQLEIADAWGYTGKEGVLPVEQFMQDYFDNTRNVRYASAFFTDDARTRPVLSWLVETVRSRAIGDHIRMGPTHIWVTEKSLEQFATSLPDVLRLMSLANQHRRRISHRTWQAIRLAMQDREPTKPGPETIGAFLSLLSKPGRLASLLRRLHELRVIDQLIPAFKRTRGLLQFNAYHKFTVDEHCIRSVEAATEMQDQETAMGRRYRRLKDKPLLHLALLIHDIGKGYEEDHCIVGARIARETAERLELDPASSEILEWLVLKHLVVNTVALRHDLSDPQIVLAFAKEVGSIRRLELLIVHGIADLIAVGPGTLTDWKLNLIEELYIRTRRYFESGNLPGEDDSQQDAHREKIRRKLVKRAAPQRCLDLLESFPLSLMRRYPADEMCDRLLAVAEMFQRDDHTLCTGKYDPRTSSTCYTIICRERLPVGTVARVTGALTICGTEILRAGVATIDDNLVWDDFWVQDPDYPGEPPKVRIDQVCECVRNLVDNPDQPVPPYRRTWGDQQTREPDSVNVLPSKVVFDNETMDQYTILSFFAYDQVGLLHRITSALAEQKVILNFAKIDTHLDQVADVFYVTELDGSKIESEERQQQVRQSLLHVID